MICLICGLLALGHVFLVYGMVRRGSASFSAWAVVVAFVSMGGGGRAYGGAMAYPLYIPHTRIIDRKKNLP